MMLIPSMDDWWDLTRKYPQFRKKSHCILKHYGYMALLSEIEKFTPRRILEFGHGFNKTLFKLTESNDDIEVWGIYDFQNLHYFPPLEEWEKRFNTELVNQFPRAHFVRGLLGTSAQSNPALQDDYFDIICSVSVLEEVSISNAKEILEHCFRLLRPDGLLIITHDICLTETARINEFIAVSRACGFIADDFDMKVDLGRVLLESPTTVMLSYQSDEGEGRKYRGHWTTLLATLRKPGQST